MNKQELVKLMQEVLKPGKDKGSPLGIIDTRDFQILADKLLEKFALKLPKQ